MKVGIITLPLQRNYGGMLQSYALQYYLQKRGHEAVLIDRQFDQGSLAPLKLLVKKCLFPKKYLFHKEAIKIAENPSKFIQKYINPKTLKITSESQLSEVVKKEKFDAIITGSDQVWRLAYSGALKNHLFLDFVDRSKTKKLSYAASFGVGEWKHSQEVTTELGALLKEFDAVSVREDTGVEICDKVFGVKATQHLDPTMLLDKEVYIALAERENEPTKEGNILIYMLDITADRQAAINKVAETINGVPFLVNAKSKKPESPLEDRVYPTVTGWLQGFKDAEFVFVDSFHGCVFAILFNKPFLAYGNKQRGLTRFTSLLKLFGLESRLILQKEDLTEEIIKSKIDWEPVNKKLAAYREETANYFDENL